MSYSHNINDSHVQLVLICILIYKKIIFEAKSFGEFYILMNTANIHCCWKFLGSHYQFLFNQQNLRNIYFQGNDGKHLVNIDLTQMPWWKCHVLIKTLMLLARKKAPSSVSAVHGEHYVWQEWGIPQVSTLHICGEIKYVALKVDKV